MSVCVYACLCACVHVCHFRLHSRLCLLLASVKGEEQVGHAHPQDQLAYVYLVTVFHVKCMQHIVIGPCKLHNIPTRTLDM